MHVCLCSRAGLHFCAYCARTAAATITKFDLGDGGDSLVIYMNGLSQYRYPSDAPNLAPLSLGTCEPFFGTTTCNVEVTFNGETAGGSQGFELSWTVTAGQTSPPPPFAQGSGAVIATMDGLNFDNVLLTGIATTNGAQTKNVSNGKLRSTGFGHAVGVCLALVLVVVLGTALIFLKTLRQPSPQASGASAKPQASAPVPEKQGGAEMAAV